MPMQRTHLPFCHLLSMDKTFCVYGYGGHPSAGLLHLYLVVLAGYLVTSILALAPELPIF